MNNGEEIELNDISYDSTSNCFLISDGNIEVFLDYIPKYSNEFNQDEYSVYNFKNDVLNSENDIYQVFLETQKRRIGWIFPIQVLNSTDHQYSNFSPFLNYSYVAFYQLLLNKSDNYTRRPSLSSGKELKITDFYPENTIVFVLSKDTISDIFSDFNIDNLIPGFFQFNYHYLTRNNLFNASPKDFVKSFFNELKGKKKISIKYCPEGMVADSYLNNLFKHVLPSESHHLVRYHNVYQVLEMLIEEIFNFDFDSSLTKYNNSEFSRMDFKVHLQKILDEQKRIKNVIMFSRIKDIKQDNFHSACNDLLSRIDKERSSFVEALYRVRSLIVHDYRIFRDDPITINLLDIIIFHFEIFITDLLILYHQRKEDEQKTDDSDSDEYEVKVKAEGRIERSIEIAKELKKNGVAIEVIIQSTELSKEEIEKL